LLESEISALFTEELGQLFRQSFLCHDWDFGADAVPQVGYFALRFVLNRLKYRHPINQNDLVESEMVTMKRFLPALCSLFLALSARAQTNAINETNTGTPQALTQKTEHAEDYYNLGNSKAGAKDYEAATDAYTKAIESKPDYAAAYLQRATTKSWKQDYKGAFSDLTTALKIDPNLKDASDYLNKMKARSDELLLIGELSMQSTEHKDEAMTNILRAIEMNPDNADAYSVRGIFLWESEDVDGALVDLNRAISLNRDNHQNGTNFIGNTYFVRGRINFSRHNYDKALADLDKAIELKPDYEVAFYLRAALKVKNEEYEDALTDLDKAIKLKPDFKEAIGLRDEVIARIKEENNPLMKEATRSAWNRIQAIEAQLSKDYSNDKKRFFRSEVFYTPKLTRTMRIRC